MLQETSRQLLRSAAAETIERIKNDQELAPAKLRPLLAYIAEHLFDKELSVNRMKKECSIRDNSVAIHFHSSIGQPPHTYIANARMDVASNLLSSTDLPVWRISEMLGFSSIQVFSRAFFRARRQRPISFRRAMRHLPGGTDHLEATSESDCRELMERASTGCLSPAQANALLHRLVDLYVPRQSPPLLSA
jgi:AraC-like DNA-binding protein